MKKRIVPKIVEVIEDDGRWLDPKTLTYYDKDELEDIPTLPEGLDEIVNSYLTEHNHDVLLCPYNALMEFGRLVTEWAFGQGRTFEDTFNGYKSIQLTLDKYVLQGIGVFQKDSVIMQIRRK